MIHCSVCSRQAAIRLTLETATVVSTVTFCRECLGEVKFAFDALGLSLSSPVAVAC